MTADIPASIDRLSMDWGELTTTKHALRSAVTMPTACHAIKRAFAQTSLLGRAAQGPAT